VLSITHAVVLIIVRTLPRVSQEKCSKSRDEKVLPGGEKACSSVVNRFVEEDSAFLSLLLSNAHTSITRRYCHVKLIKQNAKLLHTLSLNQS
jgi:hypothetical protein